jgi:hypothetical protein
MPDPLEQAQELFEAGLVEDAADLLRQVREAARARGRFDVVAEIEGMAHQMRTHVNGTEREAFDRVLERGLPARDTLRPVATALLDPAVLVLSLVAVVTVVAAWIVAGSEGCGSDLPSSAILLILSAATAGGTGLLLGLRRAGHGLRKTLVGLVVGIAFGGTWLLIGGFVWGAISFDHCPILDVGF